MGHCGPKHVEPPSVMNKPNHKTLCILLDHTYILQNDTRSIQYQIKILVLNVVDIVKFVVVVCMGLVHITWISKFCM